MKRALIIHGWESNSKEHWYQEEKPILEKLGYVVEVPDMPNAMLPILEEWLQIIEDFKPDYESILIGHSLGVPTILRYLETAKEKVGKVIFIAGFASSLHLDYPNAEFPDKFVQGTINWNKIKENAAKFIILNQKNDPWVPLEKGKEIAELTGGEFIEVEGNNHFDKMDLGLINKYL